MAIQGTQVPMYTNAHFFFLYFYDFYDFSIFIFFNFYMKNKINKTKNKQKHVK